MPTIRNVANMLDCSPTLVANVWTSLRAAGLIATHRRGGSFVINHRNPAPAGDGRAASLDLSSSIGDRTLIPSLGAAFEHALSRAHLHAPGSEDITEELREAAAATWPYLPEAMMAMDEGSGASVLVLEAFAGPARQVAVEEPCNPRILSDIRRLGLHPIGVRSDENGPCPDALEEVLRSDIELLVIQPRTAIPTGRSIPRIRLAELAAVISAQKRKIVVYEDDNYGVLSGEAPRSIGEFLPDQVLILRYYSKPFGFDMKISILAGASVLLEYFRKMPTFGGGRTSRIFQDALAFLLSSPSYMLHIEKGWQSYLARMEYLHRCADQHDLKLLSYANSLTACVMVNNEQAVLLAMAGKGYILGSGSHCISSATVDPFIRVGLGNLPQHAIPSFMEILAKTIKRKPSEIID